MEDRDVGRRALLRITSEATDDKDRPTTSGRRSTDCRKVQFVNLQKMERR